MSNEPLTPEEQNAKMAMRVIRAEIKRVFDNWDPLCVRGLKNWQEEYNQYVGPVSVLVRKRAAPIDIAAHLNRLVTQEWNLPDSREKCLEVAEKMHRTGKFLDPA